MGRRKLEMKRIEDKNSRQVTFSKRRAGLNKKARHLSILCDVDVAVVVFSSRGKLYEYCSGSTDSVDRIISKYQKICLERTNQEGTSQDLGLNNKCPKFQTCNELLQSVRRLDEEGNKCSVTEMTELEEELTAALMHTRSRKTQLMMERISTFHEHERRLIQEKEELKEQFQVAAANQTDDADNNGDGGEFASRHHYQTNSPQQLQTLPLFKD